MNRANRCILQNRWMRISTRFVRNINRWSEQTNFRSLSAVEWTSFSSRSQYPQSCDPYFHPRDSVFVRQKCVNLRSSLHFRTCSCTLLTPLLWTLFTCVSYAKWGTVKKQERAKKRNFPWLEQIQWRATILRAIALRLGLTKMRTRRYFKQFRRTFQRCHCICFIYNAFTCVLSS